MKTGLRDTVSALSFQGLDTLEGKARVLLLFPPSKEQVLEMYFVERYYSKWFLAPLPNAVSINLKARQPVLS